MELQPLNTFRQGSNEVYLLRRDDRELLVKRYRGEHPHERCDYERDTLRLWATCNLPVPRLWDVAIPEFTNSPYLVTDYLGSLTLQEWLQDARVAPADKLAFLERIFCENQRRHHLALERREPRLIQADPNSSNVLRVGDTFHFIDFERPAEIADLAEAAAVEIGKFCRWTVRDFGRPHLRPVMELLVKAYAKDRQLLRLFIERTTSRSFQWLHRWRDRRRKVHQPADITKYDLADALTGILGP